MLATLAFAVLLAPQPPAAEKPAPMTVEVRAAAKADAPVQAWAKELRAALGARKEEFRLAKAGETAEFVVQLDSIANGAMFEYHSGQGGALKLCPVMEQDKLPMSPNDNQDETIPGNPIDQ